MRKFNHDQKGSLLILAMIAILVLAGFGFALWFRSNVGVRNTGDTAKRTVIRACGESAINLTAKNLREMVAARDLDDIFATPTVGAPPTPLNFTYVAPPSVANGDPYDYDPSNDDHRTYWSDRIATANSSLSSEQLAQLQGYLLDRYELMIGYTAIDPKKCEPEIIWVEKVNDPRIETTVYRIVTKTASLSKTTQGFLEATIVATTNDSIFKYLKYSEYPIPIGPNPLGRDLDYEMYGKIHTNKDLIVGVYGGNGLLGDYGNVIFSDLDVDSREPFLTTSGNIWEAWKYSWDMCTTPHCNGPGETADYPVREYYIGGSVKTLIDHPVTSVPLVSHGDPWIESHSYPVEMNDPTWGDDWAYPNWTLEPDRDSGIRLYGRKMSEADNEAHDGEILTNQPEVEIPLVKTFKENLPPIDPAELLQPPASSDPEILREEKFANKAKLRIVDGVSYVNGIAQSSGPLSFTGLMSRGIITVKDSWYYIAQAGQMAYSYKIDMDKLTTDEDLNSAEVDSLYIGKTTPRVGKVQYPAPGCPTGHTIHDARHRYCTHPSYYNCLDHCMTSNVGRLYTVTLTNGKTLGKDFGIASNLLVALQGDLNTPEDPDDTKSLGVYSDSAMFLSNNFQTSNWSRTNVTGPNDATETSYNVALMTGKILPLSENWNEPGTSNKVNLIQSGSEVYLWKSRLFPITIGYEPIDNELDDAFVKMWVNDTECEREDHPTCYKMPRWIYKQDKMYISNPPPMAPKGPGTSFVGVLSIRELDKWSNMVEDPYSEGSIGDDDDGGDDGGDVIPVPTTPPGPKMDDPSMYDPVSD